MVTCFRVGVLGAMGVILGAIGWGLRSYGRDLRGYRLGS